MADRPADPQFNVFLSHNSRNKPAVIKLAERLQAQGLRVWLDVWELRPGHPWQEALEQIIKTTGAAAVLVGADGLGPWEDVEMRACLNQFARRKLPVIPVLLPGCPEKPELPLLLQEFTWVDLRDGQEEEGLKRLVWGITGKKPSFGPSLQPPTTSSNKPDASSPTAPPSIIRPVPVAAFFIKYLVFFRRFRLKIYLVFLVVALLAIIELIFRREGIIGSQVPTPSGAATNASPAKQNSETVDENADYWRSLGQTPETQRPKPASPLKSPQKDDNDGYWKNITHEASGFLRKQ